VIAVLGILLVALLLPASAEAKVTCEGPHIPDRDAPLRGLPDHPIVGRTYRLTATLPDRGVNPVPHLGAEYCGRAAPHESRAGAGGWFRRVPGAGGTYLLELRFRSAGPWAVSFMDRHGWFYELGIRTVLPANGISTARQQQPVRSEVGGGTALLRQPLGQLLWIFAS
jgi:hypothetical protein